MVTNNAWNSEDPAQVAKGGTGVATTTAYAVQCGGTTATGPFQPIASVGTSGQVLTSNGAAALPTMQAAAGDVTGPGSSTDNALARWDGTGGDTLQDSTVIVTDAGEMTNASQPAFTAHNDAAILNVTGDGTNYTIIFNAEDFDQNSDYDTTTGVFTAPVTGKYLFSASVSISGYGAGHTSEIIQFTTSGGNSEILRMNPAGLSGDGGVLTMSGSFLIDLSATDTASVLLQVKGSTLTVDIPNPLASYFSGVLIC